MATSIVATFPGQRNVAIGNVLGSGILNILGIVGLSGLLAPGGLLVLGHAKRDTLEILHPWRERKTLKHGDSLMRFLDSGVAAFGKEERLQNLSAKPSEILKLAMPLVVSNGVWTVQHFINRMFLMWYSPDAAAAASRKRMGRRTVVAEDAMYIALEDQTGYLKLFPTDSGWKPGRYKVEIHACEQINDMSLMGTMRFTITASSDSGAPAGSR